MVAPAAVPWLPPETGVPVRPNKNRGPEYRACPAPPSFISHEKDRTPGLSLTAGSLNAASRPGIVLSGGCPPDRATHASPRRVGDEAWHPGPPDPRTRARIICHSYQREPPPQVAEAIFAPFERGGRDAADAVPGVGLGLALSRGLARDLGGDLVLEPAVPHGGACFKLSIPLRR